MDPVALCKYGHPIEGDNIYRNARGVIECRLCRNAANKRWRDKNPTYMSAYRKQHPLPAAYMRERRQAEKQRGKHWRFCPHCGKPL